MSKPANHQHYPFDLDCLPDGWSAKWIGDVADEVSPGFPSGKHNRDGEGVPHLRPMNVSPFGEIDLSDVKHVASDADARRLQVGDVLFNNTNSPAWVGKTACIRREADFAFSNHMTRVRFGGGVVPEFAATQLHYLQMCGYFRHRCTNHVNQASIASKVLANTIPLVLPPPAEQRRIVGRVEAMLGRVEAGAASLGRAGRKVTAYRAAVLKAATSGDLTADWRSARGPDPEPADRLLARLQTARRDRWERDQQAAYARKNKRPPKNWQSRYQPAAVADAAALPELPPGWCWATSSQVCSGVDSGSTPPQNEMHEGEGEVPFVKVYNLTHDGRLDFTIRPTFITREYHQRKLSRSVARPGDVLMNIVGPPLGKVSLVPDTHPEWNMNQAVVVFRPLDGLLSKYLLFCLLSRSVMGPLTAKARATAGQFNISVNMSREVALPLPPLAEQGEIVERVEERLSVADAAAGLIAAATARGVRLRQSILRAAFTGRLIDAGANMKLGDDRESTTGAAQGRLFTDAG